MQKKDNEVKDDGILSMIKSFIELIGNIFDVLDIFN